MDIGGINRLKPATLAQKTEVKKNSQSSTERDAQGNPYQRFQKKPTHLTLEQETEALQKLNEMPAFSRSGLRAEFVRDEGVAAHIVIRNAAGEIVRHLSYEQVIDLYIDRNSDNTTGRLLKSAA